MPLLKNLLATLVAIVALVVGLAFSVVLLAVFVAVGLGIGAFFWWKTRKLRRAMRAAAGSATAASGVIIEGEVVEVNEVPAAGRDVLPHKSDSGNPP